nr:MAG TPA: hypothetical protein [Caudoviricetes sp.]
MLLPLYHTDRMSSVQISCHRSIVLICSSYML